MTLVQTYPPNGRSAAFSRTVAFGVFTFVLSLTAWTPDVAGLPGGISLFYPVCAIGLAMIVGRGSRLQPAIDPTQSGAARVVFVSSLFISFWALLTAFQAVDPFRVGRPVAAYSVGPALFYLLNRVVPPNRIDQLINWQIYLAAAAAFLSLVALEVPFLADAIFGVRDRSSGFFKHPNQFGIALSTIAPVLAALALTGRNRFKWTSMLALVIVGFVLAGSKANTAVAMTAIAILAVFGALTHRSAIRSLFFLIAFSLLGVAALFAAWELVWIFNPRMGQLLGTLASGQEIASVSARYTLWDRSMAQFWADPLFGQGGGALIALQGVEDTVSHSHNLVLDAMRTLGIPGLAAIMVFSIGLFLLVMYQFVLAVTLRSVGRHERMKLAGLTLGMVSYYVANMSSDSFGPSTSPVFWIIFTLSIWQGRKLLAFAQEAAASPRQFIRLGEPFRV